MPPERLMSTKNQEVDGVVGSDTTALDESLRHGRHDVLHEVVAQRRRLCFQKLLLLPLDIIQTLSLQRTPSPWTTTTTQWRLWFGFNVRRYILLLLNWIIGTRHFKFQQLTAGGPSILAGLLHFLWLPFVLSSMCHQRCCRCSLAAWAHKESFWI